MTAGGFNAFFTVTTALRHASVSVLQTNALLLFVSRAGNIGRMGRRIGQWDNYAIGLLKSPKTKPNP
jgi:hypothetical protein